MSAQRMSLVPDLFGGWRLSCSCRWRWGLRVTSEQEGRRLFGRHLVGWR